MDLLGLHASYSMILVLVYSWVADVYRDSFYFELLTYLARIRIQLSLLENDFMVEYVSDYFRKSTSNMVVKI